MTEEHFKKLENMYLSAPVNKLIYEPEISITHSTCEISIEVKPDYFHAANSLHGSVYFKMLDDAAYFASAALVETTFLYTKSFEIHFIRPVTEGKIKAVGKVISQSSNGNHIASAQLFNHQNKVVAEGEGIFVMSHIPLSKELGYL